MPFTQQKCFTAAGALAEPVAPVAPSGTVAPQRRRQTAERPRSLASVATRLRLARFEAAGEFATDDESFFVIVVVFFAANDLGGEEAIDPRFVGQAND